MSSSPDRTPLVLLLVVALGLGVRFVRERGAESGGAPSTLTALDSQLSRANAGGKRPASRSSRAKRSRAKGDSGGAQAGRRPGKDRTGGSAVSGTAALRSERTPLGALPVEILVARSRDSARAASAGASGTRRRIVSGGEPPRSPDRGAPSRSAPIDVETASAEELERLPRIGPALARRIVEDREAHGPFGSLAGLQRVRGIGPAMANLLRGRVTFNDARRP